MGGKDMSIRIEQYWALVNAQNLLCSLLDPKQTPGIPGKIRRQAHACLRHYPPFDINGVPLFSQDNTGLEDADTP